ncbi:YcaO-like family protein [Nocardioides lijunqiniae]|uniref:YcaO-like family protein n=1 Tax=Nocardioides lijunqiniae TaxID=2760832 RepID=UPI001878A770|nr:YcaO-like family protein [Nocardioides lijunqiniae]
MSTTGVTKVYTHGTHRVRDPAETWAIMRPKFDRYGVTRVSDITGLDVFAIPVAMAVRPLAWTLSVSQGKGQSLQLAKVSAVMEAIELWHAEQAPPPVTHRDTTAEDLGLSYSVADLGVVASPFLDDRSPLSWVSARGLVSAGTTQVPLDAVCFRDPGVHQWSTSWIRANSNGLASGNSTEEAILHALYEVVERDALSRPVAADIAASPTLHPESIRDETCRTMIANIHAAGGRVAIQMLPSAFDIPTFKCIVWSWDFPLICSGYGAHLDPVVALSRALTEAAQGRLATIAGSRDDLEHFHDQLQKPQRKVEYMSAFGEPDADFDEIARRHTTTFDNTSDELAWLVDGVQRVLDREPLVVDLSTDADFAVVKVIVPGGRLDVGRIHPRAERAS